MDNDGYQYDVIKLKLDTLTEKVDQVQYRLASIDNDILVHIIEELQRLRRLIERK